MSPVVKKNPRALEDLTQHYAYIGENNLDAADRFLKAVEKAFALLAQFPMMGHAWKTSVPHLVGIRSWTVPKFKNYRIFYRPLVIGIEVLHVFRAQRNIQRLLEEEEPE